MVEDKTARNGSSLVVSVSGEDVGEHPSDFGGGLLRTKRSIIERKSSAAVPGKKCFNYWKKDREILQDITQKKQKDQVQQSEVRGGHTLKNNLEGGNHK